MSPNFLRCDREQGLLLPPSLREWLPEGHLAWFVLEAVEELDLVDSASFRPHEYRTTMAWEILELSDVPSTTWWDGPRPRLPERHMLRTWGHQARSEFRRSTVTLVRS